MMHGTGARLTHDALAADSGHLVDGVGPAVSSVAITSDPGDGDTYATGDAIQVTVPFSEAVKGILHPQLHAPLHRGLLHQGLRPLAPAAGAGAPLSQEDMNPGTHDTDYRAGGGGPGVCNAWAAPTGETMHEGESRP